MFTMRHFKTISEAKTAVTVGQKADLR